MGTYKSIIYVRSTDIRTGQRIVYTYSSTTYVRTVLIFYVVEWNNNQYVQYLQRERTMSTFESGVRSAYST